MTTTTETTSRPDVYTFELGTTAMDAIGDMFRRVHELKQAYGPDHKWAQEAEATLLHELTRLLTSPFGEKVQVMRDMAQLSLYVISGSIHFGIIFHSIRRGCTREGCKAVINDDGKVWTYMPEWYVCADGEHVPTYPLDAPTPGSWSFHS